MIKFSINISKLISYFTFSPVPHNWSLLQLEFASVHGSKSAENHNKIASQRKRVKWYLGILYILFGLLDVFGIGIVNVFRTCIFGIASANSGLTLKKTVATNISFIKPWHTVAKKQDRCGQTQSCSENDPVFLWGGLCSLLGDSWHSVGSHSQLWPPVQVKAEICWHFTYIYWYCWFWIW